MELFVVAKHYEKFRYQILLLILEWKHLGNAMS